MLIDYRSANAVVDVYVEPYEGEGHNPAAFVDSFLGSVHGVLGREGSSSVGSAFRYERDWRSSYGHKDIRIKHPPGCFSTRGV